MNALKSFGRLIQVEVTSAQIETMLSHVNSMGIETFEITKSSELVAVFWVRSKDFTLLKELNEQRGDILRVVRNAWTFGYLHLILQRKFFLMASVFFVILALYLPGKILFVRIEGNNTVPSNKILEEAERCGIEFGASRRKVRSEKVKNELLSSIPDLQWAGINTAGCVATISVTERTNDDKENEEHIVSNIVAQKDGYILRGTVTRGSCLFQIGQSVKTGEVLISGYTDCGTCIQATRAEGEVYAQTRWFFEAVSPKQYLKKVSSTATKRKISVLYRKKRINLWKDSGISDSSCGRMYEEYYITLPGGFCLPFALCIETYGTFETAPYEVMQDSAESQMYDFAQRYLSAQMIAGSIQKKTQQITAEDYVYRLNGKYICTEMIGREQQEKIGDTNGKIG